MATIRKWICSRCNCGTPAPKLFDSLRCYVKKSFPRCSKCFGTCSLHVEFPFGLNAANNRCKVLAVFEPQKPEYWKQKNGRRVTFYPFLVVLERLNRGKTIWLPYWHTVGPKGNQKRKYGQWAPIMDIRLFQCLLQQARREKAFKKDIF